MRWRCLSVDAAVRPRHWTRSRPAVLGLVVAALVMLAALAPSARAQEVPWRRPPTRARRPLSSRPTGAAVEPPPVATDPAPKPEPVPVPPSEPSPPPEQPADPQPTRTFDEQPVADRPGEGKRGGRDWQATALPLIAPACCHEPLGPSVPVALAPPETQLTAAPLGWDPSRRRPFRRERGQRRERGALAGGGPPSFGGLGVLGVMCSIAHEKDQDAASGSRPNATLRAASVRAVGGPGPGQSMGLAGGGGGASAGIALLMLLGLARMVPCSPRGTEELSGLPTATWRPSAYVPPIEHPGQPHSQTARPRRGPIARRMQVRSTRGIKGEKQTRARRSILALVLGAAPATGFAPDRARLGRRRRSGGADDELQRDQPGGERRSNDRAGELRRARRLGGGATARTTAKAARATTAPRTQRPRATTRPGRRTRRTRPSAAAATRVPAPVTT